MGRAIYRMDNDRHITTGRCIVAQTVWGEHVADEPVLAMDNNTTMFCKSNGYSIYWHCFPNIFLSCCLAKLSVINGEIVLRTDLTYIIIFNSGQFPKDEFLNRYLSISCNWISLQSQILFRVFCIVWCHFCEVSVNDTVSLRARKQGLIQRETTFRIQLNTSDYRILSWCGHSSA